MNPVDSSTRRHFIGLAAQAGGGILLTAQFAQAAEEQQTGIPPTEDLMREHGVLRRVLLIYAEFLRRMDKPEDVPADPLADATKIIRTFVEDYHEKLEEDYLFPRFEKANKLVDLVQVLRTQHQAGRQVTDKTLQLATAQALKNAGNRAQLADSMRQFIRMYQPHAAREDTVLFPAFRQMVPEKEFDSLGEEFEKKEDQLFGENGFEKVVDRVAAIEKTLGIYDLPQFTPKG
ncbi:MAG: hemerythrin domain-containing protein [Bacillota bacterium]